MFGNLDKFVSVVVRENVDAIKLLNRTTFFSVVFKRYQFEDVWGDKIFANFENQYYPTDILNIAISWESFGAPKQAFMECWL